MPIIATITRLLCREPTLQNEYLLKENEILRSKITKRMTFTDDESWTLVESAMAMGRELMEQIVRIGKPKMILAWQRRLENQKWDYSDPRKNNSGRPKTPVDIERLVCRMACENEWGYGCIQGELRLVPFSMLFSTYGGMVCRLHLKEKGSLDVSFYQGMPQYFYVLICSRRRCGHLGG